MLIRNLFSRVCVHGSKRISTSAFSSLFSNSVLFICILVGILICVVTPSALAEAQQTAKHQSTASIFGPPLPDRPNIPSIRVTLSQPTYWIKIDAKTGEPRMPDSVVANAAVQNWPAGAPIPQKFTWHIYLDWDYAPYPTHHDISKLDYVHNSPIKINFGNQIRGGMLSVVAKAPLNGHDICGQARADVLGVNPTHAQVLKLFPCTRFGLIASKIGMAESEFQQFTSAKGDDPGGRPYLSRTNDIGIMQLNAPTGSITSADQVWDWRANVRRGIEELAEKRRTTVLASRHADSSVRIPDSCHQQLAYLNLVRLFIGLEALPPPVVPQLSTASGSGTLADDPDIDHIKLNQVERDMIRRYNGGREYSYVAIPDPTRPELITQGWQIDITRGGVHPKSGDLDYVRHVLRAHSGLQYPPPPKPVKVMHNRSSHLSKSALSKSIHDRTGHANSTGRKHRLKHARKNHPQNPEKAIELQ